MDNSSHLDELYHQARAALDETIRADDYDKLLVLGSGKGSVADGIISHDEEMINLQKQLREIFTEEV